MTDTDQERAESRKMMAFVFGLPFVIVVLLWVLIRFTPERPVPPPPSPRPTVTKTIGAKASPLETRTEFNGWGLVSKKEAYTKQVPQTVYYLVFTDGTKAEVPVEVWATKNVGDKYEVSQ